MYKWAYIMIYYIVHVLPDPRGVYRAYVEYMQLTRIALSFGCGMLPFKAVHGVISHIYIVHASILNSI